MPGALPRSFETVEQALDYVNERKRAGRPLSESSIDALHAALAFARSLLVERISTIDSQICRLREESPSDKSQIMRLEKERENLRPEVLRLHVEYVYYPNYT